MQICLALPPSDELGEHDLDDDPAAARADGEARVLVPVGGRE